MWRVLRTALMWLVALALPLQGLAAATMLSCGPGHHRMAAGPASAAGAQDEAHDHSAHGHGANAPAPAVPDGAGAADESPTKLHQLAKFKCSACAVCGVTTVLPSSTVTFDPQKQTASFILPDLPSRVAFLTNGPERPPRSLLV